MSAAQQTADHAGALIGALLRGGVTDAVVSPGSRSTPLVLALHARSPQVRVHVVLDERTAAFVALGIARVQQRPVMLVATSGSAGGHWLPAVIEASQSRIPLLLLTADRPVELQDHGAPQTVPQHDLFSHHVRLAVDVGAPSGRLRWLATVAARALDAATGPRPGPVHLNLPFRKPLWELNVDSAGPDLPLARVLRGAPQLSPAQLQELATRLASAARGVIVCGPRDLAERGSDSPPAGIARLADQLGWPLIAEPASGVRWGLADSAAVLAHADATLRSADVAEALRPDLILRVGQVPTCSGIASWVAQHGEGRTLLIDRAGDWQDPDHVADTCLVADPDELCDQLADLIPERTATLTWLERWRVAERAAAGVLSHHSASGFWSGAVVQTLASALPAESLLHVASSSAIRTLDTFGGARGPALQVSASRGANGIDGTIATATGQALAWGRGPVVTLLGDLAFLHDVGSLRHAVQAGAHVVFVVLDNRGGAIFRQLPIAAHPSAFDSLFSTPQQADLAALSQASGARTTTCETSEHFTLALREALATAGAHVLLLPLDAAYDRARARDALSDCADAVREALGLPPETTGTAT